MIDLHTHTNCSDGTCEPIELLKRAEQLKLTHLSITDHNTVDAYFKIGESKKHFSGVLVSGIEPECFYRGRVIELLGYDFDIEKMRGLLQGIYLPMDKLLEMDANRLYEKLIKSEVKLSHGVNPNNWNPKKDYYASNYFHADITQHSENKKIISDEASWANGTAFYRNYISNPKSPLYIDQSLYFPSAKKIVQIIRQAGGKVFIPHIFLYGDDSLPFLESLVSEFDIDGIECFYPKFNAEQTEYLLGFCKRHNLLTSAGSDFHGRAGYPDNVGTDISADNIGWLK